MNHPALSTIMDLARPRAEGVEIYYLRTQSQPVQFENNRLKSLTTKSVEGVAVRVIRDGRLGFAASTDLTRLEDLVSAALETATIGDPAEITFAPAQALTDTRPPVTLPTTEVLVAIGKELVERMREYNPEILVDVGFNPGFGEVQILTDTGAYAHYQRQSLSASLGGNWVRGEDFLQIYSYEVTAGHDPDYEQLLHDVIQKYTWAETTTTVTGGALPVLFTPRAVASVLAGLFESLLSGQAVVQQATPLAQKVGQRVFDPQITLTEDPTLGVSARGFDDECTPTQPQTLIDQGVVRGFYWDKTWAQRAGCASTGNGYRGGLSRPGAELVNLCLAPGHTPYADLVAQMSDGIIVEQVLGAGQSNQLAGEFSVNLDLGYRVVNGEIVGRVKNTMVAGSVFEAPIQALSQERQWVGGGVLTPAILFNSLGVATRS
ncbi:Putative Zn-dependent protease [Gloeomargarita lithophora Alchichica-D10]|uniref:Zn-dependent protease n=1 Tax=Gloeomargarita lithophora Alchichica-D10 TaxID=1188229 RepID=A0A1J0ADA8_9CYAN|nr:TldD/PmbA family protein [Gloeomargarita lithophora]APB33896.1 Putative Zn-dependent protease [Gloeomargarita lithophora Alchichica-D10]